MQDGNTPPLTEGQTLNYAVPRAKKYLRKISVLLKVTSSKVLYLSNIYGVMTIIEWLRYLLIG